MRTYLHQLVFIEVTEHTVIIFKVSISSRDLYLIITKFLDFIREGGKPSLTGVLVMLFPALRLEF